MSEALSYVLDNPGCPIFPVAKFVGPHGSTMYGYRTVHRCIRAGLIKPGIGSNGRYSLTLTEAGRAHAAPVKQARVNALTVGGVQ